MTAKITLIVNHDHVAKVLAERRKRGIGETFKVLPWWRPRDGSGRFAPRSAMPIAGRQ